METENILVVAQGWEGGKWGVGLTAKGYEVSFWGGKKCSEIDCSDSWTTL